jgi:glycosyltransferase involved in cell wall biosynthesis
MIAIQPERSVIDTDLDVRLDRPLPSALPAGRGTAVFCVGTCFHRHRRVVDMTISVDGARHRPLAQRMPRLDRFRALHPGLDLAELASLERDPESRDPDFRSYRSGFWATIPIAPQDQPGALELCVEARLADGSAARAPIATIDVVGRDDPPSYGSVPRAGREPLIAVCMATFNPEPDLFRAQADSIRAQTDQDWICLVSDDCSEPERFHALAAILEGDERFVISRAAERAGFYRNFERVLEMVPPDAEFVALSDHDDRWYPEKLEALRRAIGSADLAYSDLRRVDTSGGVRAETLWEGRRRNESNLASILISNTVVGASCLFRRRAVEHALPFPDAPGWNFHDHWLAAAAMSLDGVAYVDRPLYDYVQHPGAVLGQVASGGMPRERRGFHPRTRIAQWRGFLDRWRSAYFSVYLQRRLFAQVLLARSANQLTRRKRRALQLLLAADRSPLAFLWLALRPARALVGRNETLGTEAVLARGILWRQLTAARVWRRERPGSWGLDAGVPPLKPQSFGGRRRRWLARR